MKNTLLIISLSFLLIKFTYSQEIKNIDLYFKTLSYIEYQNYDKALISINKLILEENNNFKLYKKQADIYFLMKNYKLAVSSYKKANSLKQNTCNYNLAESFSLLKNKEQAIFYLKKYLKQKYKLSESEIKLNPNFKNIENTKAWTNIWKQKNYTKYDILLSEAKYLIKKGNIPEAFEILDNILTKKSRSHRALCLKADLFVKEKNYKRAEKYYSKAISIKKKNIKYLSKRANAYFLHEKYKKSLLDYLKIKDLEPENIENIYNIAKVQNKLENFIDAELNIEKYLKYMYKDINAIFLSAEIYKNSDNLIKALSQINNCIETEKKAEYYNLRGDIFFNMKNYKYAKKDYSLSLDISPNSGEILFKKGLAEYKSANYKVACQNWKQAEDLRYYKASDYLYRYCKNR